MASQFRFSLKISREKYMHYYEGNATSVQTYAENGLLIQFPASALKPWVTHLGIQGYFMIKFDDNNKLISLDKLAELNEMN